MEQAGLTSETVTLIGAAAGGFIAAAWAAWRSATGRGREATRDPLAALDDRLTALDDRLEELGRDLRFMRDLCIEIKASIQAARRQLPNRDDGSEG